MDKRTIDLLRACEAQILYADEALCFQHCADPEVATKLLKRLDRVISSVTAAQAFVTTRDFVRSGDLPSLAREIIKQFFLDIGHPREATWVWRIGKSDGSPAEYIPAKNITVVDDVLRSVGFRDGESVDIEYTY